MQNPIHYHKTVCPLDCPDGCGIVAKVVDGRLQSIKGDPEHPYTSGFICKKMRDYPARVYDSHRILYPQLRVGKKGEGSFQRIGWDEALRLFAEKIHHTRNTHGGEAILPFQYAGNMGHINRNAGYALYNKLGTSRLKETICSAAASKGWAMHYDGVPGSPPEIAADADLIIAWGINVRVSNIHFWQYIAEARKKGARLLVIDPYRNETARLADQYLQIEPGGDGALALGAMKVLLEANLLDMDMIGRETSGFSELASYLRSTPLEEFSNQCGLSQAEITKFAMLLQSYPSTFIRIGIGLSRNSRGGMSVRSIISLGAALGLFGGRKGQGVLLSSKAFSGDTDKLRFPELAKRPTREINMAHLGHALTALQPAVRMFIVYNSNPLSVCPDASLVRLGLASEDLFTVVHEQVMTPTARYADLLLPATTFLENRDLYTGYGHFYLGVVDPVIQPLAETRSNFDLFQALAKELGYEERPFMQTLDERLSSYIETIEGVPEDISFAAGSTTDWIASTRRRSGESVMDCRQQRFCFVADSDGTTPGAPHLLEATEFSDVDLISRYPFKLITPPHNNLLNSTFGERYSRRRGEVLICPEDADSLGVTEGSLVQLSNHRGSVTRIARITDDTARGLLVAEGLFWQQDDEGGINDLTSQKTTDIGQGPTFHESRVGIKVISEKVST